VVNQETFDRLVPLACGWAKAQEEFILVRGVPLSDRYAADAALVGVRDIARIRVLIVEKIPLPEDVDLAEAAKRAQIITDASRCVPIGHGILIRADAWGDRELILHNLMHVVQCERCGGLESYICAYLSDRHTCSQFTVGSFEDEARRVAREVCAASTMAA
jgi:hypothetical protein